MLNKKGASIEPCLMPAVTVLVIDVALGRLTYCCPHDKILVIRFNGTPRTLYFSILCNKGYDQLD